MSDGRSNPRSSPGTRQLEPTAWAAGLAAYGVLYALGIRFGMAVYVAQEVSTFWPNSGLLSGLLVVLPVSRWPALFAVSVAVDAIVGGPLAGRPALLGGALGLVNCGESALVAQWVRRRLGGPAAFHRLGGVLSFILAVAGAVFVSGLVGSAVTVQFFPQAEPLHVWRTFAAGDALGHVVVAPLVVGATMFAPAIPRRWSRWLELGLLVSVTLLLSYALLSRPFQDSGPLAFALLLPAFWCALRFDLPWVVLLSAAVALIAVSFTAGGYGPFLTWGATVAQHALALQSFLLGLALTTLSVGAALRERRDALEAVEAQRGLLELRVAEQTAQLRIANEELTAFNQALAHDLRQPLQVVSLNAALLSAEGLGTDAATPLRDIHAATGQMEALVADMSRLSQVSRRELRVARVDLSALAAEIGRELRRAEPERAVELEIEPGITANGDAGLLRIVLTNLLGNAWKYTSKQPRARVRVHAEETVDGRRICVSDDGVGFEADEAAQLFRPFTRLPSARGYAGTGIGLSTVRRAVERHRGTCGARPLAQGGATFWFTLPG